MKSSIYTVYNPCGKFVKIATRAVRHARKFKTFSYPGSYAEIGKIMLRGSVISVSRHPDDNKWTISGDPQDIGAIQQAGSAYLSYCEDHFTEVN